MHPLFMNHTNSRPSQPSLVLCEVAPLGLPAHESTSPFCIKVHRALIARGLEHEHRHAPVPAAYRDLNPAGQVPVLLVDGEPVFDSTRILARLEELVPDPLPARQRAEALLWEELADTALNGFLVASRWADERNWPLVEPTYFGAMPPHVRADMVPSIRANIVQGLVARDIWRHGPEACWQRFVILLDQLDERAPDDGFWINDRLTAADFALFGQLHSLRLSITPWQMAEVARRPRLSAYLDRVQARTAAHRRA